LRINQRFSRRFRREFESYRGKAVDKVTVRLTYYSKLEAYTVAVKIETSVRL